MAFRSANPMIDKAIKMLAAEEGRRKFPYRCTAGKLTIGVGRNIEDRGISYATMDQMLTEDIEISLEASRHIFGPLFETFTQNRQLAILGMIFQLGEARFRTFSETIKAIKAGDWDAAAERAGNSLWAKQTPQRAARVINMLRADQYPYG